MSEKLYKVNVSDLEVRKDPRKSSNVHLKRDTVVISNGQTKQYRKEIWVNIQTVCEPIVVGYVQRKYLKEI